MFEALEYLNGLGMVKAPGAMDTAHEGYEKACAGLRDRDEDTARGIWEEIKRVWEERGKA